MIKKIFKGVIVFFLLLFICFGILYFLKNEKIPVGNDSEKADILAYKMNAALNKKAWDSTNVISWTHKGSRGHEHEASGYCAGSADC